MTSKTVLPGNQPFTQCEQNEAEAFDRLAEQFDKTALQTSDRSFDRYRKATWGEPLFYAYPDLVFVFLGRHFLRREDPAKPLKGVKVLDLGAGEGAWSVILAEQGVVVTSLEIAPKQVALARERMRIHNLSWDARVGSAFALKDDFPQGSFDLIFGQGVLHHLTQDLDRVYAGMSFLLREGGHAVFSEPVAGSRLLRIVREKLSWLFPLDKESPDERPLTPEELLSLKKYFKHVEFEYTDFLAKLGRRIFRSIDVERRLSRIDRRFLQTNGLSRLAGGVFIAARK